MTFELDRAREHQERAQRGWDGAQNPALSTAIRIHHQNEAAVSYLYARAWVAAYFERITPEWQAIFRSIDGVPVRRDEAAGGEG